MDRTQEQTSADRRFEALVAEHADVVWRFAMSRLGNHADADDVAQETFARAYVSLDRFRGDASLRTWLLSICRNLCVDQLRRRVADAGVARDVEPQRDHADAVAARTLLEEAMSALPAEQREAFVLVDVLGLSGTEAADVCDVPPTTLRSRRSRAHERLVEAIAGEVA